MEKVNLRLDPGPEVVPGGRMEVGKPFEELVLPHLDDLYRVACRLEKDPHRAEDLLQQALYTGFRKFSQFTGTGTFRSWMSTIVRRTFLNQLRKARTDPLEPHAPDLEAVESRTPGPAETFLIRQLAEELKQGLDRLPEDQRLAVFLIDVLEYSYSEAAEVLGTPPGTVASRVARGRATLRRLLGHLAGQRGFCP